MRFEEGDQRREQAGVGRLGAKLVRPDSGQVEEAVGPSLVAKRCRKRGKGNGQRIIWRLVGHALGLHNEVGEATWPRF